VRANDPEIMGVLARIHDEAAWRAAVAERAFLHALDGGCQVPVGALALFNLLRLTESRTGG